MKLADLVREYAQRTGMKEETVRTWVKRKKLVQIDGVLVQSEPVFGSRSEPEPVLVQNPNRAEPRSEPELGSKLEPELNQSEPEALNQDAELGSPCPGCAAKDVEITELRSSVDGWYAEHLRLQAEIESLKAQIVSDSFQETPAVEVEPNEKGEYDQPQLIALLQAAIRKASGLAVTPLQVRALIEAGRVKPRKSGLYSGPQLERLMTEINEADWADVRS